MKHAIFKSLMIRVGTDDDVKLVRVDVIRAGGRNRCQVLNVESGNCHCTVDGNKSHTRDQRSGTDLLELLGLIARNPSACPGWTYCVGEPATHSS